MDQLSSLNNKLVNIVYFAVLVFCLVLISSFADLSTTKEYFQVKAHFYEKEYSTFTFFEHNDDLSRVAGVQDERPSATTLGGAVKIAMQQPQHNEVLGVSLEDRDEVDATTMIGSIELAKRESKKSFSLIGGEAKAEVKGESVDSYYEKPDLSTIKGSVDYAMMLD